MPKELPHVSVFSLGGTIASTSNRPPRGGRDVTDAEDGGVQPTLDAGDLVVQLPEVHAIARVETVAFRQVASGELTLPDIAELAIEIRDRFRAGAAGIVVTQGTDTIEETAFALDLLLAGERPVVVTGAMRNPTLAGADGPANLLAAVRVAASDQVRDIGCVVVMNDEIHAARFVRKTHASSPAAFESAVTGPLGWIVEGRPRIAVRPDALMPVELPAGTSIPAVALVTIGLGDDGRLLTQLASLGYAGAVVEAFGGGHVPAAVAPLLGDLAARMPVVLASRTGAGEVLRQTYSYPGSERDLLRRNLIPAGYLDGLKSRVLLALLLASGADGDAVRAAFATFGS